MSTRDIDHFEEANRQLWEFDSTTSSVAPSEAPAEVKVIRDEQNRILTITVGASHPSLPARHVQQLPPRQPSTPARAVDNRQVPATSYPKVGTPAHSRLQGGAPAFIPTNNRSNVSTPNIGRNMQSQHVNPSTGSPRNNFRHRPRIFPEKKKKPRVWAEPAALVTTEAQTRMDAEALRRSERDKYLQPLEEGADPYGVGYFVWTSKDTTPMDLLGWRLEALNQIRVDHKVYIDWQESTRCLKISSRSEEHHELYVLKAIKAIRKSIEHAKAATISATPVYTAIAPTPNAMRDIICPMTAEPKRVTDLKLTGLPWSPTQKAAWKQERMLLLEASDKKFQDTLTKSLLKLAPNKHWMRLRVHFGHIVFISVHKDLRDGKQSFQDFSRMITNPRITGQLERQLPNASITLNVKKRILDYPERFSPVSVHASSLDDVKFKDTEIVFVTMPDVNLSLRLEAEIDRSNDGERDEYHVGTISMFHNHQRNKMMEITMVDIEKEVDWQMEVISDNTIPENGWPRELETKIRKLENMIRNSVTTRTAQLIDPLGLPYPAIRPIPPAPVKIDSVVLRSSIQYKTRDSGYIVDISIYRSWEGGDLTGIPEMKSGMSFYHPSWESATENIEKSSFDRGWDSSLSHFFDNGFTPESRGIKTFRTEVEIVQGFLSAAQNVKNS